MNDPINDMPATQACTVAINFGLPRQSRELVSVAAEVEAKANAKAGTTRAASYYFRKTEGTNKIDGLQSLKTFQGNWKRALEYFARYPYIGGLRILPAQLVPAFMKEHEKFKGQQLAIWQDWAENEYMKWKEEAPSRMGDNYDPEDYPTLSDCKKRFKCVVDPVPLSSGKQWQHLSAIGGDLVKVLEVSTNEKIQAAKKEAQASMWADVLKPIQHIVDVLQKDKSKIHETLIGNVLSIVDLVPAFTFENDPHLLELAAKAKHELGQITTEDLRKSDDVRKDALAKAQALVTAFKPFARQIEM